MALLKSVQANGQRSHLGQCLADVATNVSSTPSYKNSFLHLFTQGPTAWSSRYYLRALLVIVPTIVPTRSRILPAPWFRRATEAC